MNDLILNLLANDSFTVSDFKAVGLTADNTKLESEDRYKSSQMIQENELFKDDNGNFSEDIFHQYYLYATQVYNRIADETYIEDITKNTFYSKDNIFAPGESPKIDETPIFVTSPNPFLQHNSLTRVGKKGDRTLSISEIAQGQKIYDSDKQQFREESINDRAFGNNPFKWLRDVFSEPLVIAQWDEDGEHIDPITGEAKIHKKGDYKYNDEGTFYYETLNGRDVYGKQVLNRMNTLTVDGSKANKYDFFDSDDLKQKSFIGSVMKNLALVGSMFLPVVGKPIIAASIATQSVGLLGALGKMFLGSENETVNNMHAWSKTVNRQTATEYASQNTWCWENLINMIGDTVGQLAEQRFLFTHVPALFKGTKGINAKDTKTYEELVSKGAAEIREKTQKDLAKAIQKIKASPGDDVAKQVQELTHQWHTMSTLKSQAALEKYMQSYNHLGSIMSKAYMTGITVQDTYGEAKANGASDMEALALTLGYAAGEAWILNTGLGEWIMPELHGDKLKYRAIINALKKEVKPLSEDITETATKEGRQNLFKKIFNIGKRIATDDYARQHYISQTYNPMSVVLAHAAGEGFEEVSEELLADVSKSAFNVVNWLRGDDTRIAGTWENVVDRYGMSLLGGFIGGGISSVSTDFSYAQELAKMSTESAIQEIVYMINNDKVDDFLKFANKAELGNKHLSFSTDENGNFKPGTKENNQDSEIKKMLNYQVKLIRDVINAEGAKFSENSLFDALTLKDLRYLQLRNTATVGAFFQEYNSLITDIYKKSKEIRDLVGDGRNTDTKKKELTEQEQGLLAQLKQELNDLRVRKDAFISGKRAPEFIATALYEAQQALHGEGRGYIWQEWAEAQTNKKYEELTEAEIEELKPKYKAYRETEMKNDVIGDARQFVHMVGLTSNAIKEQENYIKLSQEQGQQDALRIQTWLGNLMDGLNMMAAQGEVDPDEFIQKAQTDFNRIIPGTALELARPLFDEETIARLNYIQSTPDTEGYGVKEKSMDRILTIFEAFADYSDTITKKFIDQGYIHPEVKNHLLNTFKSISKNLREQAAVEGNLQDDNQWHVLQKLSPYLGASVDEVVDLAIDKDRNTLLNSFADNLDQKIEAIQQLSHTPIIDLLENFKIATSESNTSVKQVMQAVNTILNQSYEDLQSFNYSEQIDKQLDEVIELIDLLSSTLYATRVDEAGVNNAWGYSKTLNELNKKYGNADWVELAEIQGTTADLLMQDLAMIKQKLYFAKNLRKVNNGQKLNRQTRVGYNKQYIFYNKVKKLFQLLPEKLPEWNLESVQEVLSKDLLLARYNGKTSAERKFSLTPDEKLQIEQEQMMLDDALYQFFQDNKDKVDNVDELAKLINPNLFDMYDPATRLLDDEVSDLDDRQFIFELAAKAAIKSSDFYNTLRQTFNDEKAPVPMQEQSTYLNVAMVLNGDVVNNFAKAYAKSILQHFKSLDRDGRSIVLGRLGYNENQIRAYQENPEAFGLDSACEKFENVVLTEGIAGSGKSGGVFDSTVRVLRQVDPAILEGAFVVSATLEHADSLKSDLKLNGKTFSSSHNETENDLIRYFYSDYTPDYDNGKLTLENNILTHKFTLKKDLKDLPKVIFVDEASRYDYVQMRLLKEAAQYYGIAVLAAGDFDQISASASLHYDKSDSSKVANFAPSRLNFIGGSKLGVSFRTLNSQMSKNQNEVIATLYNDDKKEFNFYYWENENELRGFKVYESKQLEEIKASIEKIKKSLKPNEKIGFLYADKEKSLYGKIKDIYGDLIEGRSITDAQGLEGSYYIVDLNRDHDKISSGEDQSTVLDRKRQVYTGFTRSKHGGIIINDKNVDNFTIKGIKEEESVLESITPAAIAKASQKRKEILDEVFKDYDGMGLTMTPLTPVEIEATVVETFDEKPEEDGLEPEHPTGVPEIIPEGMYKSKEEAEKVDLSIYTPGLELYDKDGELVGTIQGVDVVEQQEADGTVYYTPAVVLTKPDNDTKSILYNELRDYTIKDSSSKQVVPKYKVGDVFYTPKGDEVKIVEVLNENPVKYKISDNTSTIIEILEQDLSSYSQLPPVKPASDLGLDLGENIDSEEYKIKIETANGSNLKQTIESDGRIHHWMYTFNAYETGVLWDDNGHIKEEHFKQGTVEYARTLARIDNVNGLIKTGAILPSTSKKEALAILAQIHSVLMSDTDNSSVVKAISDIIKVPVATIQYGIKSSAGMSNKSGAAYGTRDSDTDWHVFDKHRDEISEYAQSDVVSGDAISRKTVVALFRDADGKKVFEVTLGVLNSPLTIGQMQDQNGNYVYPRIGQLLEQLTPGSDNTEVFEICSKAIDICKEDGYTDLENLFKAFLFTSNAFVPLAKPGEFNLANKTHSGPNVIMKKGDYQKNGERKYETKYIDLAEFANDSRIVVSDVWIPTKNNFGGNIYAIRAGYPGVFVSYNTSYDKKSLAQIYMDQHNPTYKGVKDVEFYYIIPPEASVKEYLRNFRNAYLNTKDGGTRSVYHIGNMWTSYKLLKNIYQGGDFTESKLPSMLLNRVEFAQVESYVKQLIDIENKTDWDKDPEYMDLLEQYKKLYKHEKTAKKYALRNIIIKKQSAILNSTFPDTAMPVWKVFINYIANAAYKTNDANEVPDQNVIDLIMKHNQGNIRYKVLYDSKSVQIGMFVQAKTNNLDSFSLDTITEEGNSVKKQFQINSKIDPPIFEIEELTTAVGILSQWEYSKPSDTSSPKKMGKDLNAGTRGYMRDNVSAPQTKNNLQRLKDSNKHLFGNSGLFKDIQVKGEDDPALDEVHFANEILTQFNSQPNNFGFAVVSRNAKGDPSVKMYAFKIDQLPNPFSQKESETLEGIGGITVNTPLIFEGKDSTIEFATPERVYQVQLDNDHIILTHWPNKPNTPTLTKVEYTKTSDFTQDVFDKAVKFLNTTGNRIIQMMSPSWKFDEVANMPLNIRNLIKSYIDKDENVKKLFEAASGNLGGQVNIRIGDKVLKDPNNLTATSTVLQVNGSLVTLDSNEVIDVTKETLYKKEDNNIMCPKTISIAYGK